MEDPRGMAREYKESCKGKKLERTSEINDHCRCWSGHKRHRDICRTSLFFRNDAVSLGLDPNAVRINLFNANKRLFPEGPAKVGLKLERSLDACGVTTLHGSRVLQEKEGVLTLSNGETMSAGLCVWTLGLLPNPMLQSIGLPITRKDT